MSAFSVTAQITVPVPPAAAFERFEAGELLEIDCDRLVVGAAISLSLPVGGNAGSKLFAGAPIMLLGRVSAVRRGQYVRMVHHQPWTGTLTLRFRRDGIGTRIVIDSSMNREGVAWLAYKRGYSPPEPPRKDRHRVGLLVSKSGSAAVFAQATESLAELAIEEINADGGVGGLPMDLMVSDDGSNSATGAAAALHLARSGCRTIFACVTSATFSAAANVLHNSGVLLIHTVVNEGGRHRPGLLRLGERAHEQLRAGVPELMAETGVRTWFFVGQRYSWSFRAHWDARAVVAEQGGAVLGDSYVELGTTDFSGIIEQITRSGAELILSSLVGQDEVLFERQCAQYGLRRSTRTFALVLDEATQQLIGSSAADGVWAAFSYFQEGTDNSDLVKKYGGVTSLLPPTSSLSATTYDAIQAYARAAVFSPEDPLSIHRELAGGGSATSALVHKPIMLAESRDGRLLPRSG